MPDHPRPAAIRPLELRLDRLSAFGTWHLRCSHTRFVYGTLVARMRLPRVRVSQVGRWRGKNVPGGGQLARWTWLQLVTLADGPHRGEIAASLA